MTSSGSPSEKKTRLFAMAPTSTPRAAAATAAVEAASGSVMISPATPAERRASWTMRLRGERFSVMAPA